MVWDKPVNVDILQAEQIMFDRLVTAWGSTTVLVLPNEAAPEPTVAWVQADIVAVDEPQVSLGPVGGGDSSVAIC